MTYLVRLCMCVIVVVVVASFGCQNTLVGGQQFEGETCVITANTFGECRRVSACDTAREDIRNGKRPEICSYEKDEPIICCLNPNINWSPASSAGAPLWPSEGLASPPTQRPPPTLPQRPTQRPPQAQPQRPTQRPTQRPPQAQPQRPTQRPTQRPPQAQPQRPTQRPPQAPPQRPTQRPMQRPTPLPEVVAEPPVTTSSEDVTPKRPQWWQIPKRKRTESPAVIEKPTSPMPEALPTGNGSKRK